MEAKDLLVGSLTKLYNKTEDEIAELIYTKADDSDELILKEDALNLVLDHDAKRVADIKQTASKPDKKSLQEQFEQGVKKGYKEGKEELEAELKAAASIESNAIGSDLVKEVVNAISECNLPSEEQIKTHSAYLELEKSSVPKTEFTRVSEEFETYKLNQDRLSKLKNVKDKVLTIFQELKPIVSENPVVAQTRLEDFLYKFDGYDYEHGDNGDFTILKDGKRVEDEHANAVKFPDFVRILASKNYDFAVSDDRGQAGNTGGSSGSQHTKVPKDEKEYLARYSQLRLQGKIEESIALNKVWEESQNK